MLFVPEGRQQASVSANIGERLTDENPDVRGRAAEALGLVVRAGEPVSDLPEIPPAEEDAAGFLDPRIAFLRDWTTEGSAQDIIGTFASIVAGTEGIVEAITTPDDGACPNCGLGFPEDHPPMCPRCGAPLSQ